MNPAAQPETSVIANNDPTKNITAAKQGSRMLVLGFSVLACAAVLVAAFFMRG